MKLTLAAAALAGGLLALVPVSGASAAPIGSIGKAVNAVDSRTAVHYYRYHHHHHCWWRYGRRFCRW